MTFTKSQQQAIDSNSLNIICLAGAGSGKSSTLIGRIHRLVNDGVAPAQIVTISFTQIAAKVLQHRLGGIQLGACCTLHSFLLRLIQKHYKDIRLAAGVTVITDEQRDEILTLVMDEMSWKGSEKAVREQVAKGRAANQKIQYPTKVELCGCAFFQTLAEENLLTYNCILYFGLKLLRTGIALPYTHLLWDEMQDSSDTDFEILEAMPVANKWLCGDDAQAVFWFRNDSRKTSEKFMELVESAAWEVHKLEDCFRCDISICDIANRLIANSRHRTLKSLKPVSIELGVIELHHYPTAEGERAGTVGQIQRLIADGIEANEIAVLLRTNYLAGQFAESLKAAGIPVRRKVELLVPADWSRGKLYLSLLANPNNDRLAFMAVRESRGPQVASEVRKAALSKFTTINEVAFHLADNLTVQDAFQLLPKMGISETTLRQMRIIASKLPEDIGLPELLIALSTEDLKEDEGDGVRIGTIHSHKGCENECIFLPAFEQEIIPGSKDEDVEESRRLAYVGLTRAKNYLFLSYCDMRQPKWGEPYRATPSPFLGEMGLV